MSGMSLIVKTVTRILWPILLLFAFYVSIIGHITPGGGFQGGVVLAIVSVLSVLSYGLIEKGKMKYQAKIAIIIIIVSLFVKTWKVLFGIPLPKGIPGELFSAGAIPLTNLAVGLMVGLGLTIAFYALILTNSKAEGDIH